MQPVIPQILLTSKAIISHHFSEQVFVASMGTHINNKAFQMFQAKLHLHAMSLRRIDSQNN